VAVTGTPLRSALRAAFSTGPLTVAIATALLAWFVTPWVIPGGLALYSFWVYVAGPSKLRIAQKQFVMGLDLKDAPPGLKRWNAQLNEALARIQADLQHASGQNARLLRPIGDETDALGDDIRRLIRQAYQLHRYLNQTNTALIAARAAHLEAQVAATQDPYSKQQLQEAATALRHQLANCEQIRTLIGRTEATLENMQASLQSIGSSVVKLGAGDLPDAGITQQDSLERLASARSTVASLEQVLERVELA
jgi:hypothetical protein